MGCSSCNHGIRVWEAFGLYGKRVSNNPVATIIIAVLLNALLAVNIRWMTITDDYRELFTDTTSDASANARQIRNTFPDLGKTDTYARQFADDTFFGSFIANADHDIIIGENRKLIREIHEMVLGIRVKDEYNAEHGFEDFCIRNSGNCLMPGSIYFEESFVNAFTLLNVTFPQFVDSGGVSHIMSDIIGSVDTEHGFLKSARSLRFTYYLRLNIDKAIAYAWEEKFITSLSNLNTNLTLSVDTSSSKSSGLPPVYLFDPKMIFVMFGTLCVVAFVTGMGGNCISQRGNLVLASILSGCLSALSALGFCSALGVSYVNMTTVMPLLTIGLAATKALILLSGVVDAPIKASPEERVTYGVKATGVPTTVSMTTIFIAHIVCGLVSKLTVLKHFCWFTGSAVVLSYINHMTFFASCVVLDEKRVALKRHWCACHSVYSLEEMRAAGYRNNFMVVCCSGAPAEQKEEIRSFTDSVSSMILPRFLLLKAVKVIVFLIYFLYLGFAIWGCTTLETGFRNQDVFKTDSAIYNYLSAENRNFDNRMLVSLNLEGRVDYWNSRSYNEIQNMINAFKESKFIDSSFEINWLSSFHESATFVNNSETDFVTGLKSFLMNKPEFRNDIRLNENETVVSASRMYVLSKNVKGTSTLTEMLTMINNLVSKSNLNVYAYSPDFIYLEHNVQIWEKSAMSVFITFGVCFIFAFLVIPNPTTIVFITLSVISTMVGVAGFMSFWAETVNSFTIVYFTFSVGLAFIFPTYVCYIFMNSDGFDRRSKASETIVIVSGTILISCILLFVNFITLLFASTNILLSLFKTSILLLIISILHCVFLVPIILSVIGPNSPYSMTSRQDTSKSPLFPNKSSLTWSVAGVNAFDAPFSPMKIAKSGPPRSMSESENRL